MDAKNQDALTLGPEWMLGKLANLFEPLASQSEVEATRAVQEFKNAYGELSPGLSLKEYIFYAKVFQHAWRAKSSRDKEYIGQHITTIFERESGELVEEVWGVLPPLDSLRSTESVASSPDSPTLPLRVPLALGPDDPHSRPAVVADFNSGKTTIKPRTLLDWLAKSLLECRDKLAICERKGCSHSYFVKMHARQVFCSSECANTVRQEKKEQWWAENREEFIEKWRRKRKAAREKSKGGKRGRRTKQ